MKFPSWRFTNWPFLDGISVDCKDTFILVGFLSPILTSSYDRGSVVINGYRAVLWAAIFGTAASRSGSANGLLPFLGISGVQLHQHVGCRGWVTGIIDSSSQKADGVATRWTIALRLAVLSASEKVGSIIPRHVITPRQAVAATASFSRVVGSSASTTADKNGAIPLLGMAAHGLNLWCRQALWYVCNSTGPVQCQARIVSSNLSSLCDCPPPPHSCRMQSSPHWQCCISWLGLGLFAALDGGS